MIYGFASPLPHSTLPPSTPRLSTTNLLLPRIFYIKHTNLWHTLPARSRLRTLKSSRSNDSGSAKVFNEFHVATDGHEATTLIDTGADYSVLSEMLFHRLRDMTTWWDGTPIRNAGGRLITPIGRCSARLEMHGETSPVKFIVLQDRSRNISWKWSSFVDPSAVISLGKNKSTRRRLQRRDRGTMQSRKQLKYLDLKRLHHPSLTSSLIYCHSRNKNSLSYSTSYTTG